MDMPADPRSSSCLDPVRVLVVDDDAELLGLIENELAHAGFEVIKAIDGIDALSCMYASRPDVIVVDLSMPRMSGLELIAQVRTVESFQDVTVVAMSGHPGLLRRAICIGVSAAIVKPASIEAIIAILRRPKRRICADVQRVRDHSPDG